MAVIKQNGLKRNLGMFTRVERHLGTLFLDQGGFYLNVKSCKYRIVDGDCIYIPALPGPERHVVRSYQIELS